MSSFENIARRTPVNREAALALVPTEAVIFRYGDRARSATPFPITTLPLPRVSQWGTVFEDLTGRVFGRLTVIGRLYDPAFINGKKVRWVVRCTCGYYETRRNRAIKKLTEEQQMCSQCEALERRKFISAHGTYDERRERAGKYHPKHQTTDESEPSVIKFEVPHLLAVTERTTPRFYKKTPIPPALRWRVWERDDFRCQMCGTRKHLSIDHIIPESLGGLMVIENLQTLCTPYNSKKGAKSV